MKIINNFKQINNVNFSSLCAIALLALMIILNAWVTEDAYITFRVIDNFIDGHGLRWNIDERVQVFTHPLWLFILTPIYYITQNIFLTSIILSIILSIAAVVLIVHKQENNKSIFTFVILLTLSKAFTEFSTSGLENCLSFFLFTLFILALRKEKIAWFELSFIASLAALNRLDTILFYVPIFLYLIYLNRKTCNWLKLIGGSFPFVLWEIFSLFYYGFLFPNTKYAKLNTGIELSQYLEQGFLYVINLATHDPISFLVILSSFVLLTLARNNKKIPKTLSYIATGNALYIIYIIFVGGDFMSGRFFSIPVFVSAYIIYEIIQNSVFTQKTKIIRNGILIFLLYLRISFILFSNTILIGLDGIADERAYYGYDNTLIDFEKLRININTLSSPLSIEGLESKSYEDKYFIYNNIGMRGYYSNRATIVIDQFALSDPLLSRLPIDKDPNLFKFISLTNPEYDKPLKRKWRIGHFYRNLPTGYLKARTTGDTSEMSPNMAIYYGKLREITAGDLFNTNRLKTIIEFNLGKYDNLLQITKL